MSPCIGSKINTNYEQMLYGFRTQDLWDGTPFATHSQCANHLHIIHPSKMDWHHTLASQQLAGQNERAQHCTTYTWHCHIQFRSSHWNTYFGEGFYFSGYRLVSRWWADTNTTMGMRRMLFKIWRTQPRHSSLVAFHTSLVRWWRRQLRCCCGWGQSTALQVDPTKEYF